MTAVSEVTAASLTASAPAPVRRDTRFRAVRYLITPVILVVALVVLYVWVHGQRLDSIEQRTLNRSYLVHAVRQQLEIALEASGIILLIAIPLGVALSRRQARFAAPLFLAAANVGQAFPAIGLLVILTLKFGIGLKVALICFAAYGTLPVLRNTIVGLQQIDPTLTEAARGIGMSPWRVLYRVELPLAVPVLLAGVRTTLVLTVGVATLATFVNAGGLGDIIVNGLKLNRLPVEVTGAVLAMCVAFFVDWAARIAEDVLRPRGL
jgi:osmoprotectant transport system permease protein